MLSILQKLSVAGQKNGANSMPNVFGVYHVWYRSIAVLVFGPNDDRAPSNEFLFKTFSQLHSV
jgi:hypothetical protein